MSLFRCIPPTVASFLLCSCATSRNIPLPAAGSVSVAHPSPLVTAPQKVSLIPPSASTPQEPPSRSPLPSRSEQIAQLVRSGTLVQSSRDSLVFSQARPARNPPGGLFEDAIALNRLRGELKKLPGLPESVPGTATVQGALAYLTLNDRITADLAARAIDSALHTEGISMVHVSTVPGARL